jgi:hypothetical protein
MVRNAVIMIDAEAERGERASFTCAFVDGENRNGVLDSAAYSRLVAEDDAVGAPVDQHDQVDVMRAHDPVIG